MKSILLSMLCLLGVENYGIPFGELLGGSYRVWCWEDDEGHAASFRGIGGTFTGVPSGMKGDVALRTDGVPMRVEYDPPANGVQTYVLAVNPFIPATVVCDGYGDFGEIPPYARFLPIGGTAGPDMNPENHWTACTFENAKVFKYIVKYAE